MKVAGKDFILANLEKGKVDTVALDLYFRQDQSPIFGAKGKGDVHLTGYYEPDADSLSGSDDDKIEEAHHKPEPK